MSTPSESLVPHAENTAPHLAGPTPPLNEGLLDLFLLRFDRPHTRRAYRNDLVQFFGTEVLTLDLVQAVTFVHINDHLLLLEAAEATPATMKRRIAALRGFFGWLMALGVLDRNPADRLLVRRIRSGFAGDRLVTVLSKVQARSLLESVPLEAPTYLRDYALLLTLLHCVLRRSEAAGMDLEHLQAVGPYWVLHLPKTKGGTDQFVKVPSQVIEAIHRYTEAASITSGCLWRSVSNNSKGKRLSAHSIYRMVQRYAQQANLLGNIGAHTLRHTGCTLAIEAGASLQQVQTHARHKHIQTTMVYIHQRDKLRDSAADFINL